MSMILTGFCMIPIGIFIADRRVIYGGCVLFWAGVAAALLGG